MNSVSNDTAHMSDGGMPDQWCAEHFDFLSEELSGRYYETMAKMRASCPVVHSDVLNPPSGYWVLTKYEDVVAAGQDWQRYSSAHGLAIAKTTEAVTSLPVQVDPPVQRLYKRLINPWFTPAAVGKWEHQTRELVNELIDDFIESGACDFMESFARPFPAIAFFRFAINAPAEDLDKVAFLASRANSPTAPDAAECWNGLAAWIRKFIQTRRSLPPKGDVVDAIIGAEIDGRPITDEEIIGTVQLIILGGLETTAGVLGSVMHRFCLEPEIPALLRSQPEVMPKAVEEFLRLDGSFIAVGRTIMEDHELHGHSLETGQKLLLYWGSANRDASEFPDPDTFRLDREHNRHVAFGVGPHRCAGSNLARMNLRIALGELVERLHDVRLVESEKVHYHSTLTRSPRALPITFEPGARRQSSGAQGRTPC